MSCGQKQTIAWDKIFSNFCHGVAHRQTSKPRPIENEKIYKILRVRYGRILGGSWSTNTPYWLKHNRIVLPTNTKVVAHSGRQVAD